MAKDTFLLRAEWAEDLELLTMAERGELLTMLFDYAGGAEPCGSGSKAVQIVFRSWKRFIDQSNEKWEQVRAERSKAGKASAEARRRKAEANRTEQEQANLTNVESAEQTAANPTVSVSVSDSVSDTVTGDNLVVSNDNNKITDAGVVVVESKKKIFQRFHDAISPKMSRATEENLTAAVEQWPADVVLSAIDAAIDAGKPTGAYVCGVLRNYRKAGVQTMDDVMRNRQAHRDGTGGSPQFIDEVGLMFAQMQTEGDTQNAVLGRFPPV